MVCDVIKKRIDQTKPGIWQFHDFFNTEVPSGLITSLREGSTRLQLLELGGRKVYLKREDENPQGSYKDRSLAYQISLAKMRGEKELVISSSGNAAFSAAAYAQLAGITLWVFLSPDISRDKFLAIKKAGGKVVLSRRAIRMANYLSSKKDITNLRPSVNDDSLEGYKTLGFELFEQLDKPLPVFTYVTSGSSLLGMYHAFEILQKEGCLPQSFAMQGVQSGVINSLSQVVSGVESFAGKGGVKKTRRRKDILRAISKSGGKPWHVSQEQIDKALLSLKKQGVECSDEGAAALAAFEQSDYEESVVVASGKYYDLTPLSSIEKDQITQLDDFEDMNKFFNLS